MVGTQPATPTDRAREVIRDMGFDKGPPPTGWAGQVEKKLAAEGLTLNVSGIYKARRRMVEDRDGRKVRAKARRGAGQGQAAAPATGRTGEANGAATMPAVAKGPRLDSVDEAGANIKAHHLVVLNDLAEEIGGWDELLRAVDWLRRVKFGR